ncbi:MAG: cytochrome c oxidase subunit II [Chromatocurvus sp.]
MSENRHPTGNRLPWTLPVWLHRTISLRCRWDTLYLTPRIALLLFACISLNACSGPQSVLDPAGPTALAASRLWWAMSLYAALVLLVVTTLWIYALRRKYREIDEQQRVQTGRRWIIGGGIILPAFSITVLLMFGIPIGHRMLPLPPAVGKALQVNVIGHQWRWEFHYPDAGVTLQDVLHLPVGVPVDIHGTSHDVIHSFWVPRLAGKIDLIPARVNVLRIEASKTGIFRGQCSEFCGIGHARMTFSVQAHEPAEFAALMERLRHGP